MTLIISQGVPVKTSLLYKMEWSATTLYQLMATDELVLRPLTPVTLDTYCRWLEICLVLVKLVESGVGLLQLVNVSPFSVDIVNATLYCVCCICCSGLSRPPCTNQWSAHLQPNHHPQSCGHHGYLHLYHWLPGDWTDGEDVYCHWMEHWRWSCLYWWGWCVHCANSVDCKTPQPPVMSSPSPMEW